MSTVGNKIRKTWKLMTYRKFVRRLPASAPLPNGKEGMSLKLLASGESEFAKFASAEIGRRVKRRKKKAERMKKAA